MRIYRVLDQQGRRCHVAEADGVFRRIEGDILGDFTVSDQTVAAARVLAPLDPPAIFAIGLNYRAHAAETGKALPDAPVVFAKAITALNHPGEAIVLPACGPAHVDYEVELAIVIGQKCRNVPADQARRHILGYTIANDVSARDWQGRLGQWVRAKSFDTFCPLGPCIDTDVDPADLRLTTTVNGQLRQDSRTSDLIFHVEALVAYLSSDLTLLPGTVICTGTPGGVGVARTPPVFLRAGDVVTCAIEGIGELTNPVVAADGADLATSAGPLWGR